MAFDWLGTFNKSQLDRFLAFARSQAPLLDSRLLHLQAEMVRIGSVTFSYEGGVPKEFVAEPPDSYIGKLVAAYEVLGGNPFQDLRFRTKADPVFTVRATEATPVQYMSNGEVIGARGLADAPSAEMMRSAKTWLNETLKTRFDRLERKIRRAMDYSDELQNEIDTLTALKQVATADGSLEQIASSMTQLLTDPNYRAIFDDAGADPFGLTSYAPFSSYDAVTPEDPNVSARSPDMAQRQNTGFVGPDATGTEVTTTGESEFVSEQAAEEAAGGGTTV